MIMKKKGFLMLCFAAMAAFGLVSCTDDEVTPSNNGGESNGYSQMLSVCGRSIWYR